MQHVHFLFQSPGLLPILDYDPIRLPTITMPGVAYIPIQTPDQTAFTSDAAALSSPIRSLLRDTLLLLQNLKYTPHAFRPSVPLKDLPNLQCQDHVTPSRDLGLVISATALESILGLVSVPLALYLSGWMFLLFISLAYCVLSALLKAVRGPLIVKSRVEMLDSKTIDGERWYFVNGVGTRSVIPPLVQVIVLTLQLTLLSPTKPSCSPTHSRPSRGYVPASSHGHT